MNPRVDPGGWLSSIGISLDPEYARLLMWVYDRIPPGVKHILDVGYGWGASTVLWLQQTRATVTTVDPLPPGGYAGACPTDGLKPEQAGRWTFLEGKLEQVGEALLPEYGFIFLDADHAYDSTVAQLAICWEHLAPGGVLAGHDWKSFPDDVGAAVIEFAEWHGLTVEYCDLDAGAWLIRKEAEE